MLFANLHAYVFFALSLAMALYKKHNPNRMCSEKAATVLIALLQCHKTGIFNSAANKCIDK